MKRLILILTAFVSLTMVSSVKAGFILSGSDVVINDPTNVLAFGTDTTKSLDVLMQDIRDGDKEAVKELFAEGHLLAFENGSKGKTVRYSAFDHAYLVRVRGSNHPVWFIEEIVSEAK